MRHLQQPLGEVGQRNPALGPGERAVGVVDDHAGVGVGGVLPVGAQQLHALLGAGVGHVPVLLGLAARGGGEAGGDREGGHPAEQDAPGVGGAEEAETVQDGSHRGFS